MRKYEVVVIVDPDVDDRQVNGLLEKPLAGLTKAGGTVDSIDAVSYTHLDVYKRQPQSPNFFGAENNTLYLANVHALKIGFKAKELSLIHI